MTYRRDGNSSLNQTMSEAVLSKVADRESVEAYELPPLYDVVDPEALDAVFRGPHGQVSFPYCGYLVTVDAECVVELSELARDSGVRHDVLESDN